MSIDDDRARGLVPRRVLTGLLLGKRARSGQSQRTPCRALFIYINSIPVVHLKHAHCSSKHRSLAGKLDFNDTVGNDDGWD